MLKCKCEAFDIVSFFHEFIKKRFENKILFVKPQETFFMRKVVDVLLFMCCTADNYNFYRKKIEINK